jgi:hypothetical protein
MSITAVSRRVRARGLFLAGALLTTAAVLATDASAGATTYYACVKKNGAARVSKKKLRCRKGESRLSWRSTGSPGRDGVNGLGGAAGKEGLNGTAGKDGLNGKDGVDGIAGLNGTNGRDGNNGVDGANGVDGTNGVNGTNGTNGKDGANGAVAGFSTAPMSEGVAFTSASEGTPQTITSLTLPAGSFIANAKVEVRLSDTKSGAYANVECRLVDTPSGAIPIFDTSGWTSLIDVPFLSFRVAQNTVPLTLPISSLSQASTLSLVCWVGVNEPAGGTFTAEANNAAITAVQTTSNG